MDPTPQNRSRDLFSIGGNQGNPPPKDLKIRGGIAWPTCMTTEG